MSYIDKVLIDEIDRPEYRSDIERIVKVAFSHGVVLTLGQAERVWEEYSESSCASWLFLPDSDDELWRIIS